MLDFETKYSSCTQQDYKLSGILFIIANDINNRL